MWAGKGEEYLGTSPALSWKHDVTENNDVMVRLANKGHYYFYLNVWNLKSRLSILVTNDVHGMIL